MTGFGTCRKNEWDHNKSYISNNCFFRSYQFLKGESGYKADRSMIDFYLYLLAADITEDMLFSSPDKQYHMIESSMASFPFGINPANWYAAVYSGRYSFAADILSKNKLIFNEFRGFEHIVLSENADFTDFITDNGSNEFHKKIILNLLANDYLTGGKSIFEYAKRYCPNKNLSDGEYLDQALLSLNDPDGLYDTICGKTENILEKELISLSTPGKPYDDLYTDIGFIPNEKNISDFFDEYNRLAARLMCRCAELGMKLKKFVSFRYMFIFPQILFSRFQTPAYDFEDNDTEEFDEEYKGFEENCVPEEKSDDIIDPIELPDQLSELIDSNTRVCGIYYANSENDPCLYKFSCFMPVYFRNSTPEASGLSEELEYIGKKFKEKYGYMMKLNAAPNDLRDIDSKYSDFIELELSQQAISKICNNKKLLNIILEKNILSKNNIEALIKCCTNAIGKNGNNKNALITLLELSNALNKTDD